MRVYSSKTGQEAFAVRDQKHHTAQYDCYLPERPNNEKKHAHSFDDLRDAARFLLDHPGTGIRMNPGNAIVCENVVIELD